MKKKLRKATYGLMATTVLVGTVLYAGCSSDDDDWEENQRQSLAERRMTRGAENVPNPPKPKPNPVGKIDSTMVYAAVNATVDTEINFYVKLTFSVTSSQGTINSMQPHANLISKDVVSGIYEKVEILDVTQEAHNGQILVTYRYEMTLIPDSPNWKNPAKGHPTKGFGSFSVNLVKAQVKDEKKNY